jgi:hypothetical protein
MFAEHPVEVFSPHNNDHDQEVEQNTETLIPPAHRLRVFTLNEIRDVIQTSNPKRTPGLNLITAKMLQELPKKGC